VQTRRETPQSQYFEELLDAESSGNAYAPPPLPVSDGRVERYFGPNGEELPIHVYPYAVSRHQLEQVIQVMNLPVVLTKDMDSADAVLALRSHVKNHSKLRHISKARQLPIYTIKSSTGTEDEIGALEEARLAVEQIVIPKGQPVELLPRSAKVRKMQHELVEHYRLKSSSFGDEPNRRLRIYPA
jgi:hypothetical protein